MSEEKVQKKEEVKSDGKLEKQVANIAFTVRKMKDWLEEKMGADIDGDGRVGGGPYKKAVIFLLIAGMASFCMAEDRTAIAYWSSKAKVTSDGFVGDAVIGALTINNATIRTNATVGGTLGVTGVATLSSNVTIGVNASVGGTLKVTGTISNTALTASLPVFTDANKVLVSGTTGLAVSNATVGGAALSGVTTVLTNATVGGGMDVGTNVATTANDLVVTNATVGGAALSGVGVVVTNVATATTIAAVTNGTIAVTLTVTSNEFVYLDGASNVVTNYFVTAVAINTETFTPQTANAIATLTVETGTPVVSSPTIALERGSALASATLETGTLTPTIALETGTPVVSSPTITLQTGTFAKP